MDHNLIYSKTAKGMTELKNGCKSLPRETARVLGLINGKSSVGDFVRSGDLAADKLAPALAMLTQLGLIRVFGSASAPFPELESSSKPAIEEWDEMAESLPVPEVTELSPQDSVQAWSEARRGATELKKSGFYSYGARGLFGSAVGTGPMHALVIEDDDELAELLSVLLTEKGFRVQIIGDMRAALAAMQAEHAPSLVLLDIVLPGLAGKDGFDLLSFIRRKESWAKVPVVMVTSQVSDDQVLQGLKAGADGYIFKPFKWETLYACIKSVVGI